MEVFIVICTIAVFLVLCSFLGQSIYMKKSVSGDFIILQNEGTLSVYLEITDAETINRLKNGDIVFFSVKRKT